MQSQVQQMSKKNKVTVPFYSPPFRLHGQTSADIIKEARAAVMTPAPVSIKPVYTSRPFTPNEKERTLFGKIKKNSRPPSSFSLRHLKSQETTSRVKLPSIEIISRRKNYSTLHYSKNLSLDNLTEDYDAEAFEENNSFDQEKLPSWKKAHSCPKEGRLSKVASLNDIGRSLMDDKNYNKIKREQNSEIFEKENLKSNNDSPYYNVFETSGDHVRKEQDTVLLASQNPVKTKGGGDYEVPSNTEKDLSNDNAEDQKNKTNDDQMIEKESEKSNVISEESKKEDDNQKKNEIDVKEEKQIGGKKQIEETKSVAEKSVVTESKSEYLMSLKSGFKNPEIVKQPQTVPQEILELYETARFYGVDMSQSDRGNSSTVARSGKSQSTSKEEDKKIINTNQNKEKSEKAKDDIVKTSGTKKTVRENSENVEFEMNNKKRYHVVREKGGVQEKAYKVWNNKQETNDDAPQQQVSHNTWDIFWKNSYFEEKSDQNVIHKKSGDEDVLQRLINKISELVKKGSDHQKIYEITSQLYGVIKSEKIVLDSKVKKNILRSLYLCVDIENAEVLLSIAKIFFYLKDESSLSVACKIIFKVARFDTNDYLFLREEDVLELFLEGIGRASPLDCAESCIYSYGALKFLTLNHNILSKILHLGALDLMALHLKLINNAYTENGSVGEQTQHALFQLTGALRHVAAGEGALPLFLTTNSITIVCSTLRYFSKDEDVVVNISRTLSLLSTDEIITQALMQIENILGILIDLMERYKENDKILIRLAFCLGNIVEHSDLARVQLSRSDSSLTVLLNLLKLYIDKDLEISLKGDNNNENDGLSTEVVDDVIVKVIRIIANMSMNPIVGSNLSPTTKEKKSLQLSKLLSILLMRKDPGITLLATLGCLNNISYYCNTHSVLVDITQGVERVLGLESVECQIEAARVLGNLTRHREIRDLIYSTGGVDQLTKLLLSPDQEVVRCVCGALVNMLLDSETRKRFVEAHGIDKLVKILEAFPDEWSLASLVVRAIWNSCGDDVSSAMLHNNMENLLNFLAGSLEEENWNDGDVSWEEFASVATDLLEKISLHLEST